MNREQMKSFADEPEWATMAEADNGRDPEEIEAERQDFLEQELGTPPQITHAVDITPVIAEKGGDDRPRRRSPKTRCF